MFCRINYRDGRILYFKGIGALKKGKDARLCTFTISVYFREIFTFLVGAICMLRT